MPQRNGKHSSALLELLNKNKTWELPEHHRLPKVDERKMNEAIWLQSQADDSDPWSGARTRLYIVAGYELTSDIAREAKSRLTLRHGDKRKTNGRSGQLNSVFEALEPLKRRVDEDRAWNQHYDQEWKEEHGR